MQNKEGDSLIPKAVLERLAQSCGEISSVRRNSGSINETTFIEGESGERFVLQRDNLRRKEKELVAEHEFVNYLQIRGFPAVRALEFGSLPYFIQDEETYTVYPFVLGTKLNVDSLTQLDATFEAIGKFLQISTEYEVQKDIWRKRWWGVATYPFEQNFKEYVEDSPLSLPVREIYFSHRQNLFDCLIHPARHGQFEEGIIHSDFRPEHFLFKDEEIAGVIDWTSSHHDVLVMEFARPFLHICKSTTQREQLIDTSMSYIRFSPQELRAAFYSPLLLEITEFMWVVKNQSKFSQEEFSRELSLATQKVIEAHKVCVNI